MRVLVTGGAGYIGSITTRWLIEAGDEPVVLDDLSTGHRAAVDPRARLVVGDIGDRALVREVLRETGVEAVIHLAARSLVGESIDRPLDYHACNVAGSIRLLEACLEQGVRRLVFSSSAAVYGQAGSTPILEDAPLQPLSPYGTSKLIFEQVLADVCAAGKLAAVSLRYFNAAGAWPDGSLGEQHEPETHLIPSLLQAGGRPFAIHGDDYPTLDGTCVRDYVHVCDLAAAHRLALERASPGVHRAYNVGTGRGWSVREVLETARRVTGREIPAEVGPRRPGDPPALVASPERIAHELGFRPRHEELESMLRSAWAWHHGAS